MSFFPSSFKCVALTRFRTDKLNCTHKTIVNISTYLLSIHSFEFNLCADFCLFCCHCFLFCLIIHSFILSFVYIFCIIYYVCSSSRIGNKHSKKKEKMQQNRRWKRKLLVVLALWEEVNGKKNIHTHTKKENTNKDCRRFRSMNRKNSEEEEKDITKSQWCNCNANIRCIGNKYR